MTDRPHALLVPTVRYAFLLEVISYLLLHHLSFCNSYLLCCWLEVLSWPLRPHRSCSTACVAPVELTATESIIAVLTVAQTVSDAFPVFEQRLAERTGDVDTQRKGNFPLFSSRD